jgi:hypothetical protein
MPAKTRAPMSEDHKTALAEGREQGRAVRRYLEALESTRPRRGRPRSPEKVEQRLAAIEIEIAAADPLHRLHLVQERADLEAALGAMEATLDIAALEAAFVAAAKPYSDRKGISYTTWREVGVPADVLARAGPGRRPG